MQIGTKFSVSVHMLLLVEVSGQTQKVTSDFIASSVRTNPVVIRKLMSQLRDAGLILVAKGTGGIELTRDPSEITLMDIYKAVEPQTDLFKIHKDTEPRCLVGGNIDFLLQPRLEKIQLSFEEELGRVNLSELLDSLKKEDHREDPS